MGALAKTLPRTAAAERALVVTLVFNGMVETAANDARMFEAVDAIYADLGIT